MLVEDLEISNAAGMVKTVGDVEKLLETPVTTIVVGSITVKQRDGNLEPRFWVAPDGSYALNSLGLPNPGIDYYAKHLGTMIGMANDVGKKLVVSIAGLTKEEWRDLAEFCGSFKKLGGLEVNTGCPNVWIEGERKPIIAFDIPALYHVGTAVFENIDPDMHIAAKLSPYWDLPPDVSDQHMFQVVQWLLDEGFNEAVFSNTVPNAVPPVVDGKRVISMETAGMSGRALLSPSVAQVAAFKSLLQGKMKITGVGGISSGADVKRYVDVGAQGVQVGTHFFQYGAKVFSEILQGYAELVT